MFVFLGIRETDHSDNNKRKKGLEQKKKSWCKIFYQGYYIIWSYNYFYGNCDIKKPSLKMSFFEIFQHQG